MKRIFLIGILLCVSGLCLAQHPRRAVKAYEKAQKAFVVRDYQKALEQLGKLLEDNPNITIELGAHTDMVGDGRCSGYITVLVSS